MNFAKHALRGIVVAGALLAQAQAGTIVYDPGTTYDVTPAMEDFTTLGADMAGMLVTVVQGGVTSQFTWSVLQDDFGTFTRGGNVLADTADYDYFIYADGDTWCPILTCRNWTVVNGRFRQNITQITFHGAPGGVVFDLKTEPSANFGTPGSARGTTYELTASTQRGLDTNVVYRNQVSVGGNPVVGDLFTDLVIEFTNGGLNDGNSIRFQADTDRIPAYATLGPLVTAIPEPQTWALLLGGVGLLGAFTRRRRAPVAAQPNRCQA